MHTVISNLRLLGKTILETRAVSPSKIKTKNPGILEVPEGKNVWDLTKDKIESLIRKKGKGPISKAVQNLLRWKSSKQAVDWAKRAEKWVHNFEE